MTEARARIADRMAMEIHEYLAAELPPGLGARDETWEAVAGADRAMMEAVRGYERGEISFQELEAEGVRYVAAWEGVILARQKSPSAT
jgi:hypothetical protein